MENKLTTGLGFLDKMMESGLPTGSLAALSGKTVDYFARIIPVALEKGYCIMFNLEQGEAITKHGQNIIDKMLEKLQEEGFDTSKIRQNKTVTEKIGDTLFPVTYHENGVVTVEYPTRLFCELVKEKNGTKK